MLKIGLRYVLAIFFVAAGTMHFVNPAAYRPLMPPFLPWPDALIAMSGAAEILGGIGVLLAVTRRWAGWGLVALLVAVFPANIYMLTAKPAVLGMHPPDWILWARLPLQGVMMLWALWVTNPEPERL